MIKPPWTFQKWARTSRSLAPWVRRHRRKLVVGGAMSGLVIGIRLCLPWFFRIMLKPLLKSEDANRELAGMVPQPLLFGVFVLGLLIALGLADYLMRLQFAQFAIGVVRDLRAKAFHSATRIDPRIRASGPGDLVARLIGDTARIKEGLKGFLVHVATNGLLLGGVSVVLLWVDLKLGAIFAAAYALVGIAVLYSTIRVYRRAIKQRAKEGLLAKSIHDAWRGDGIDPAFVDINKASGKDEATVTRLQGRTTWAAHAIFGTAVLLMIWCGTRAVMAGTLVAGDMLLFIFYALMTRAPVVQLARQGTRTGKIFACAQRLEQVIRTGQDLESAMPLPPLKHRIRIDDVRISRREEQGGGRRLRIQELVVQAGSRVAVVGASAAGKSTLLELLAGMVEPGSVWWDGVSLLDVSRCTRQQRIALLPQEPSWSEQPLWYLLGLPDASLTPAAEEALRKGGALGLLGRLPAGLETRLASEQLSVGERRKLLLGSLFLKEASLVLLDEPFRGLRKDQARRRLRAVLKRHGEATVVVAAAQLPSKKLFDRVIALKRGKIVFDGLPEEYIARRRVSSREPVQVGSCVNGNRLNGSAE